MYVDAALNAVDLGSWVPVILLEVVMRGLGMFECCKLSEGRAGLKSFTPLQVSTVLVSNVNTVGTHGRYSLNSHAAFLLSHTAVLHLDFKGSCIIYT